MRFSEAFGVTRSPQDDWFDPHLTVDTKLFLDPMLLLQDTPEWGMAHEEILSHFTYCYELVAKATSPGSISGKAARILLTFPEPPEFGLGYTAASTSGSGGGRGTASGMAGGIAIAIAAGLTKPEHIEEIGILNTGIGPDTISDAVCNILKSRFIRYTQDVCKRHSIPTQTHLVKNASVSPQHARWQALQVELPSNPTNGKPIILVPERFLASLPVLNADDWFDSHFNDDLRTQLNIAVGKKVAKADIVKFARLHPDRVQSWAASETARRDHSGYDFAEDPKGVAQWDKLPVVYAQNNPLGSFAKPTDQQSLSQLVKQILQTFKRFVEEQRGWSLLFNSDKSEKPEEAAQLLFLGMAQHYLRLYDVELDREVELGRGPVDFKVSSGAKIRLLIELKKVHNGKFWNGLEAQLPSYLASDAATEGWFVAIRYRDASSSADRVKSLPGVAAKLSAETGKTFSPLVIDARPKKSASNLKPLESHSDASDSDDAES